MSMLRVVTLGAAVVIGAAACSSSADSKDAIAVKSTDSKCVVAKTDLAAGPVTFRVTNGGSDVTEVYVYTQSDEIEGEVENIGPGTSRNLNVNLAAGSYEVACKPGQKGDGIRTPITVSGAGGKKAPTPTASVAVNATDYEFAGLSDATFAAGDVVEFTMQNDAPAEEHELEIFGPNGKALGEVGPTKPGATGRVVLEVDVPGTYRVVCGIDDHEAKGMVDTFTVT